LEALDLARWSVRSYRIAAAGADVPSVRDVCKVNRQRQVASVAGRPSNVARGRRLSGTLKIIAAILEQPVIENVLTHLGLQARAPPRAPAQGQALQAA
jgi:hypothetical protein